MRERHRVHTIEFKHVSTDYNRCSDDHGTTDVLDECDRDDRG